MFLFYNNKLDNESKTVIFSREESRHITKVLRKSIGDELQITNGFGLLFYAEIINDNANKCEVHIKSFKSFDAPSHETHIAIAPTKNNDRLEWFLEKATEIGISQITPIICENSERKTIKTERLNKILVSAMKQSLDYYLPKLNAPTTFKEFILQPSTFKKFIAHCEESQKKPLSKSIEKEDNVLILIGPEGDFTTNEIELAINNDFKPVSLGNKRLRTETAALIATHTIALLNE